MSGLPEWLPAEHFVGTSHTEGLWYRYFFRVAEAEFCVAVAHPGNERWAGKVHFRPCEVVGTYCDGKIMYKYLSAVTLFGQEFHDAEDVGSEGAVETLRRAFRLVHVPTFTGVRRMRL